MLRTYARPIRKRPRRFHKFIPVLLMQDVCDGSHICAECMENLAAEAEYYRPGHVWAVENGKLVYMEDKIIEHHLGRKLKENEVVVIKNDNPEDCRLENLEVVEILDLDTK
jgi:hypothetical protein